MSFVLYLSTLTGTCCSSTLWKQTTNITVAFDDRPLIHEIRQCSIFLFSRTQQAPFDPFYVFRSRSTFQEWELVYSTTQIQHTDQLLVLPLFSLPLAEVRRCLPTPRQIPSPFLHQSGGLVDTVLDDSDTVYWASNRTLKGVEPVHKEGGALPEMNASNPSLESSAAFAPFVPLPSSWMSGTPTKVGESPVEPSAAHLPFVAPVEETFRLLDHDGKSYVCLRDFYRLGWKRESVVPTASEGGHPPQQHPSSTGARRLSSTLDSVVFNPTRGGGRRASRGGVPPRNPLSREVEGFKRSCGCPTKGVYPSSTVYASGRRASNPKPKGFADSTVQAALLSFPPADVSIGNDREGATVRLNGLSFEDIIRLADLNGDGSIGTEEWRLFSRKQPAVITALYKLLV